MKTINTTSLESKETPHIKGARGRKAAPAATAPARGTGRARKGKLTSDHRGAPLLLTSVAVARPCDERRERREGLRESRGLMAARTVLTSGAPLALTWDGDLVASRARAAGHSAAEAAALAADLGAAREHTRDLAALHSGARGRTRQRICEPRIDGADAADCTRPERPARCPGLSAVSARLRASSARRAASRRAAWPRVVAIGARSARLNRCEGCAPLALSDAIYTATETQRGKPVALFSSTDRAAVLREVRLSAVTVESGIDRLATLATALARSFVRRWNIETGRAWEDTPGNALRDDVSRQLAEEGALIYHAALAAEAARRPSLRVPQSLAHLWDRRDNRLAFRDLRAMHRAARAGARALRSYIWGKGWEKVAGTESMDTPAYGRAAQRVDIGAAAAALGAAWGAPVRLEESNALADDSDAAITGAASLAEDSGPQDCAPGTFARPVRFLRRELRHARECLRVFWGLSGSRKARAGLAGDEALLRLAFTSGRTYRDQSEADRAAEERDTLTGGIRMDDARVTPGGKPTAGMSDPLRRHLCDMRARIASGDVLMSEDATATAAESLLIVARISRGARGATARPVLAMSGDWLGPLAEAQGTATASASESTRAATRAAHASARASLARASVPIPTQAQFATRATMAALAAL